MNIDEDKVHSVIAFIGCIIIWGSIFFLLGWFFVSGLPSGDHSNRYRQGDPYPTDEEAHIQEQEGVELDWGD